jgi:predicted ArsR family transcriptional regulator
VADQTLSPEHVDIVGLCQDTPQSVAELAAELDLPVGVVRVLIGDLVDDELVHVTRPVPPADLPDESILRDVIDGLRAL